MEKRRLQRRLALRRVMSEAVRLKAVHLLRTSLSLERHAVDLPLLVGEGEVVLRDLRLGDVARLGARSEEGERHVPALVVGELTDGGALLVLVGLGDVLLGYLAVRYHGARQDRVDAKGIALDVSGRVRRMRSRLH